MARTLDTRVGQAIVDATLELLRERGFAATTIEAVAENAGVGKPAIYRRFPDKVALVEEVIRRQLPKLSVPDLGDARVELWEAVLTGFPDDGPAYLRLIGGLAAEEGRHPELIEAFRANILLPRRAVVMELIERGRHRGEIRPDVEPEWALDALAGPLLARAFAGLDVGSRWRKSSFDLWWESIRAEERP
jgi:AcrR family transcriptional regulator